MRRSRSLVELGSDRLTPGAGPLQQAFRPVLYGQSHSVHLHGRELEEPGDSPSIMSACDPVGDPPWGLPPEDLRPRDPSPTYGTPPLRSPPSEPTSWVTPSSSSSTASPARSSSTSATTPSIRPCATTWACSGHLRRARCWIADRLTCACAELGPRVTDEGGRLAVAWSCVVARANGTSWRADRPSRRPPRTRYTKVKRQTPRRGPSHEVPIAGAATSPVKRIEDRRAEEVATFRATTDARMFDARAPISCRTPWSPADIRPARR